MKRIIFTGGLGNQMFQYALMLSLKSKGIKVSPDTTTYESTITHNGFELEKIFNTSVTFKKSNRFQRLYAKIIRRKQFSRLWYKEARPMVYDKNVYNTSKLFFGGNWVSEQYFKDIKEQIISEFEFKNINLGNLNIAKKMHSQESVSVHIRRGDYLKFKNFQVCGLEYYTKAIQNICDKIKKPVFYIFSNDPEWSGVFMKKFNVQFHIININNGENSYMDMYLMSQCKHNIIANSTFSWWGAYLNKNPEKIVVSPKQWLRHIDCNPNIETWTIIESELPEIE